MKEEPFDELLARVTEHAQAAAQSAAATARAQAALLGDLRPAKKLAPPLVFVASFLGIFAVLSVAVAAVLGLLGVHLLDATARATIFPALVALAGFAAVGLSREMRPAAGRRLGATATAVSLVGLPLIFFANFHNFNVEHFVQEGWPCLRAGLIVAIPTGIVAACVLRRGFVLSWKMAGLAAGTFAGLTGLAMLELHCPDQKVMHIVVWHVAVVAVSALLGLTAGWAVDARRRAA